MALTAAEVTHLYESILFRTPDAVELSEGQGRTADALTDSLIAESAADVQPFILIYQAAFNRIPDAVGLNFWVNSYRAGDLNLWDYTARIVDTPEFNAGINSRPIPGAINAIYQNALGRNAEDAGLNYWLSLIDSGQKTLTDVLYDISQSAEAKARNTPAIENLQAQVAGGDANFDGSVPLPNFTPDAPPPAATTYQLTTGQDAIPATGTLNAGDTVSGVAAGNAFTDTYTAGDVITGVAGGDNVFTLSLGGTPSTNDVRITNVDHIVINSNTTAAAALVVSKWNGIDDVEINNIRANFTLNDIQDGSTWFDIVDARTGNPTITLDYDSNENTNVSNISVNEVKGTIKVTKDDVDNGSVKTINLHINDVVGKESVLAALRGTNTEELFITGGNAGRKFEITEALDASLKLVDASEAVADLKLDVSAGTISHTVLTGSGDDVINAGNRLRTGDTYILGAGNDRLIAEFTTANPSKRAPTIDGVEVLDITFKSSATLDGTNIDNLPRIDLQASTQRADFDSFDNSLKTINVLGYAAGGLEVDYDGVGKTDLTVNFSASAGNGGNSTALKVIDADTLTVNFLKGDIELSNGIEVDGDRTTDLVINHKASGTATVVGHDEGRGIGGVDEVKTAIADGGNLERLTIVTEKDGDLEVGNETVAAQVEAKRLQDLVIETKAANSSIEVGIIGYEGSNKLWGQSEWDGTAARDLETVNITAAARSTITSWGIDADSSFAFGGGASSNIDIDVTALGIGGVNLYGSFFELEVGNESNIGLLKNTWYEAKPEPALLQEGHGSSTRERIEVEVNEITRKATGHNWLQAGSINTLNIEAAAGSLVQGSVNEKASQSGERQLQKSEWKWGKWGNWQDVGNPDAFSNELSNFVCLIGLDLEAASNGQITVSGAGKVSGFWFEDEVVSIIDASGLTGKSGLHNITEAGFDAYFGKDVADAVGLNSGKTYDFAVLTKEDDLGTSGPNHEQEFYSARQREGASSGFTFKGSAGNDYVVGTDYADTLSGNDGDDFLIGNGGNDVLNGGSGNDILVGDLLEGDTDYGNKDFYGNDIIDGGAGNDIIIGGGQKAGGRDVLTGGTGQDKFVFNFDSNHQGVHSQSGKSTQQTDVVWNDIITDFTSGGDQIVIDVTDPNATKLAIYTSTGWSYSGNKANVIVRQGTYNDDGFGTFNANGTGDDFQVLFINEGEDFSLSAASLGNGQTLYSVADHEIALLGAAKHNGSLDVADFLFV